MPSDDATLDPAAAYFAALGNFVGAWKAIAAILPGGAVSEALDGAVTLVATGLPVPMFNQGFVLDEAEPDPHAVVQSAQHFFAAHDVPFVVRMHESVAPEFVAVAADYGMTLGGRMPLMVLDPIPTAGELPAGITVDVVRDGAGLADHRSLVARGFGAPETLIDRFLVTELLDHDFFTAVVVRAGGEAVSTAALIECAGIAGVYNVATPPEHRGKGYGEIATSAAVNLGGVRGFRAATLQASDMGRPVYERMGFRTIAWWCDITPS